jgi:hypothetical protein
VEEIFVYPLPLTRFPPRALQHYKKEEIHRPVRVSLSLLEKAVDFGLGVHDHELGDLVVECNQAYVSQGQSAQQRYEASPAPPPKAYPTTRAPGESAPRQTPPDAAALLG